ncbi:MAG TPA: sigma-70 family RNA polymerase sigma factor [Vicinamibacteria bacterium]|nr:sigma-70 family RNA polymerase sigma factor [Vicinamibacteria bacterium]
MIRRFDGHAIGDQTSALPVDEFLGLERLERESTPFPGDEAALIDRCLAGDHDAFDEIVHRYQDMVFGLAYRLLGGYDEAVDVSQEVFLQIYRKLASFRRKASLRTWIYRIVINRAKNRRRWWKRREREMTAMPIDEAEASPHWELAAPVQAASSPHQALERKEAGQILRRAIDRLPFDQKTILLLKEIEGLSYEEISMTLDLPLGTVKSRLARARSSLRQKLDPNLFGFTGED